MRKEINKMKGLTYGVVAVIVALMVLPIESAYAQKSLPQAPVTFPGDTDEIINRRAQWVEGAKKEGALVWWGARNPDQYKRIVAEFNKIYPFIAVNSWRGRGEEVAAKLEAEVMGGRNTVDIIEGGEPYNYPRWRKMGILEKFTDIIPGIKSMDRKMYGRYGDSVQVGNNAGVPTYNTKQVSAAEAPKKWEDLLDPRWKGKIGLTTDMKTWTTLAVAEGGWGIEKTEAFLKKIKQQEPIWAQGHSAGYSLMIAGEFNILVDTYLRYTFDTTKPGDWARVSPVPVTGTNIIFIRKAPHPNAARLFIEWLFSPPGLATFEKVTGYGAAAPGSGTQLAKSLQGLALVNRTEEVILKVVDLGLDKRFAGILGITPGEE